jgi:RNA polymerase sigma-70 factor, ECF subfamily
MSSPELDTEELLARAGQGDASARGQLLVRHRRRLRGMVEVRMDARLTARVDPSDLVQETLVEAHRRLDAYLRNRPLPFYPWLRQLAVDRLIELNRRHIRAGKRTVQREEADRLQLSDQSVQALVGRLVSPASSPGARIDRAEERQRLRAAMEHLSDRDREILVLRHLEQMAPPEIAVVLGIHEATVHTRHLRALQRLRRLLGEESQS